MKNTYDRKETQRYIKLWNELPNKDLRDLLKLLENDRPKNNTTRNKIDAIKTLLA